MGPTLQGYHIFILWICNLTENFGQNVQRSWRQIANFVPTIRKYQLSIKKPLNAMIFNSFSLWIIGNTLHITRFRLCKLCTWFYCHISKKKISLISTYSSLVCIKLHQESLYSVWHMLFVYHELCQHLCSVNYNYFHETFLQSDIFVYYPLSILILYYAFLLLA